MIPNDTNDTQLRTPRLQTEPACISRWACPMGMGRCLLNPACLNAWLPPRRPTRWATASGEAPSGEAVCHTASGPFAARLQSSMPWGSTRNVDRHPRHRSLQHPPPLLCKYGEGTSRAPTAARRRPLHADAIDLFSGQRDDEQHRTPGTVRAPAGSGSQTEALARIASASRLPRTNCSAPRMRRTQACKVAKS